MDFRGFAGIAALLAALELLLFLSLSSADLSAGYAALEVKLILMQDLSFQRAVAESYMDKKIQSAIANSSSASIEPKVIKYSVDSEIISSLNSMGFSETGICSELPDGRNALVKGLSIAGLSEITGVLAVKSGNAVIVQYYVSGGPDANLFPCAAISNGNFSLDFRLPAGYSHVYSRVIA